MTDLEFRAPAPGLWELGMTGTVHPYSQFFCAIYGPAFMRGWDEGVAAYALPLGHQRVVAIHGFLYGQLDTEPPGGYAPSLADLFERRPWRGELARWRTMIQPALDQRYQRLARVDPARLGTDDLLGHLHETRLALEQALCVHTRLNPSFLLPLGDFLLQGGQLTGAQPAELLSTMRGSSPSSLASMTLTAELGAALSEDREARVTLDTLPPAGALARLSRATGPLGELGRRFMRDVGLRLLSGYDVADPIGLELPEVLVASLRLTADRRGPASPVADHHLQRLRDRVPAKYRERFDALHAEAYATYGVRDERYCRNDALAGGLMRRALLEAGRRLAGIHLLDPTDAVELTPAELVAALLDRRRLDAGAIAARASQRQQLTLADAPKTLGQAQPVPARPVPDYATRVRFTLLTVLQAISATHARPSLSGGIVRGLPGAGGVYEGVVRLVRTHDQLGRLRANDVLVTPTTSPAFNAVLPLLGAIVTDRGGALSHAAIVAREFGIPAVVGCVNATQRLPDGVGVRVDGDAGEVSFVAARAPSDQPR